LLAAEEGNCSCLRSQWLSWYVTKVLLLEKKKSSAAKREKLINFSLALWVFYFFSFFYVCVLGNERIEKSVPVWGLFEG